VIALVTHEVVRALRVNGRVCAIELLTTAPTPATWRLVAAECESLGTARGIYRRAVLVRACELAAMGLPDDAVRVFAKECGLSDIEWADETRREMGQ
jgi:hypothetical protein